MYHSIAEFLADWKEESERTQKILEAMTDQSLAQNVSSKDRTLGRIAWHTVTTLPEMLAHTGLKLTRVGEHAPMPSRASEIAAAYRAAAEEVLTLVSTSWTDADLRVEDDLYGMRWPRASTLAVLIRHEVHHRGQMTVLMRQAGLAVPGVYGPSRDEWAERGMAVPEI